MLSSSKSSTCDDVPGEGVQGLWTIKIDKRVLHEAQQLARFVVPER